jgi:ribosomal protein S14
MRFVIRKEFRFRALAVKFERRNNFFKAMVRAHHVCREEAYDFQGIFVSFRRNFLVRTKNRCQYTFSKHSINRFYHMNRVAFRNFASFGGFFGLQKSSW